MWSCGRGECNQIRVKEDQWHPNWIEITQWDASVLNISMETQQGTTWTLVCESRERSLASDALVCVPPYIVSQEVREQGQDEMRDPTSH